MVAVHEISFRTDIQLRKEHLILGLHRCAILLFNDVLDLPYLALA